jgi:hypothetical protein
VNANGAVQETRSSASSRRTVRPNVLSIESTSRWKWVVILGTPVLPEVGQNSATSSAAVSTLLNWPDLPSARAARSPAPGPPNVTTASRGATVSRSVCTSAT